MENFIVQVLLFKHSLKIPALDCFLRLHADLRKTDGTKHPKFKIYIEMRSKSTKHNSAESYNAPVLCLVERTIPSFFSASLYLSFISVHVSSYVSRSSMCTLLCAFCSFPWVLSSCLSLSIFTLPDAVFNKIPWFKWVS